jgi:DNA-binding transcriptional ArsR family regulator
MAANPDIDQVFRALADPHRRQLLDNLNRKSGQTLRELCSDMALARQSVSKHLAVLEAANLVVAVRRGREKLHHLNPAPIADISRRWINQYDQPRVDALADLKHSLEAPPMPGTSFVYTTYIRSTAEQVWEALTSPTFTERY